MEYTRIENFNIREEYSDSEIIIGLVGAVGTNLDRIVDIIKDRLSIFNYNSETIHVSKEIIGKYLPVTTNCTEYDRVKLHMNSGNILRQRFSNEFISVAIIDYIHNLRKDKYGATPTRTAYIVKSLKNKEEVSFLRSVYGNGFYLFGVFSDKEKRKTNLKDKNMTDGQAEDLMKRDESEGLRYGQNTRDAFQLSDFFIDYADDETRMKNSIHRIIDLMFGEPFITPTFDEYAMFMAFCASLRSADLSRQIGAVICKNDEVIATGVNDCPKYGGGVYWPCYNKDTKNYVDVVLGRDYMRGEDSNKIMFNKMSEEILAEFDIEVTEDNIKKLKNTQLGDITEYGRVVHAEMEAITMCARNNISCRGAHLYATTFPCHNCAKHIISSGIKKVTYIEPYPKSKTFEFYSESISKTESDDDVKVIFMPFFGVGPRKFIEMFSMTFGALHGKKRKNKDGYKIPWCTEGANMRDQMLPSSYIDREELLSSDFDKLKKTLEENEKNERKD